MPVLSNVVLCCTSIPPEDRDGMQQVAREMGATTSLDLTRETTHLIVGATDTPKYRYVARERLDIRVVLPSWLEAVRSKWMGGEEADIEALARIHRMPALWNLVVCVTGFNDLQQRSDIQEAVNSNGGQYHGDLTKQVSHLIAAVPSGKKYEYAGQWGIKIVAIEWLHHSLRRGMALDETLYSPTMRPEERGVGAMTTLHRTGSSTSLGKRKAGERPPGPSGVEGKRKLRRTASSKIESQNSGIWDDMGTAKDVQAQAGAEWEDGMKMNWHRRTDSGIGEGLNEAQDGNIPPAERPQTETGTETPQEDYALFHECSFLAVGFNARQESILGRFANLNGAQMVNREQLTSNLPVPANKLFCIVPWDLPLAEAQAKLEDELPCDIVTNHWVEKCIDSQTMVDPTLLPIYRPLKTTSIPEFHDWIITPTSFSGIELLHFSKAVKLTGAKYYEYLDRSTSVLVIGPGGPKSEKIGFAHDNDIPAVTCDWFWACLEIGEVQSMDEYCIVKKRDDTRNLKAKLEQAKQQHSADDSCLRTQAEGTRVHKKEEEEAPKTPPRDVERPISEHERKPQALREMSDRETNSQQGRDSMERIAITEKDPFNIDKANEPISFMTHDDEPLHLPEESGSAPPQPSLTQQSRQEQHDAITSVLDQVRANAQSASHLTAENSPQHRRHRKLGRAPSNPSSHGSRTNSMQFPPSREDGGDYDDYDDENIMRKTKEAPVLSQALIFEHEEGRTAREKLRSNGAVDEDGMTRVESIGRVTDTDASKRKVNTRRGATR